MCDRPFRPPEPEHSFLLPPTVQEGFPAAHVVYYISDLVEAVDLIAILSGYDQPNRGTALSHPQMLGKVRLFT